MRMRFSVRLSVQLSVCVCVRVRACARVRGVGPVLQSRAHANTCFSAGWALAMQARVVRICRWPQHVPVTWQSSYRSSRGVERQRGRGVEESKALANGAWRRRRA
eukprot:5235635-Pleurochrysis_carterae.AAC.2